MSYEILDCVKPRPEATSKHPSYSRPCPSLLPALLAIARTPAALDAVLDFKPLAVWGEITEKPPVGLGAKEKRGAPTHGEHWEGLLVP